MKRLLGSLTAVIVVMLMVLGYVPEVGAVTTVPQNVQVPMPLPMYPRDPAFHIWAEDFINSFFPNRPDVSTLDTGIRRIFAWSILCPLQPQLLRFHVLHDDDTLWAWGVNDRGYLGDGTTINRVSPVFILDNVFYMHISGSGIALRYDGTVWTWGPGGFSKLGIYPRPSYRASPAVVIDNVVAINSYWGVSALKQDGTIWVWGTGSQGILGCGAREQVTHNVPIRILDNVVKMGTGNQVRFALKADGSLWAWGRFIEWNEHRRNWDEVFRAYVPTMIVQNFIVHTEVPQNFTADDGTEFRLSRWAPQLRPVDMLLDTDDWLRFIPPPIDRVTPPGITPSPIPGMHSEWARPELELAHDLGLIPEPLLCPDIDLREPITREEFAAVVVYLYQSLANTIALPSLINPFTDTRSPYVLRALNADIMIGISPTLFDPHSFLTREMAATGLTRAFKRTTIPGWTYATDAYFPLNFDWGPPFADDDIISGWARESVYFMAVHNIIGPGANNMFNPRATTPAQEAIRFATTTREQALIISLRMLANLGNK